MAWNGLFLPSSPRLTQRFTLEHHNIFFLSLPPYLSRPRQNKYHNFQFILGYLVSYRPASVTELKPDQNTTQHSIDVMHYRFQLGYRRPSFIYIFSPFFAWHPESSQLPHCMLLYGEDPKARNWPLCTRAILNPELTSDHSVNKLEDRSSLGRVFR